MCPAQQFVARFGLTWHRQVHVSTCSGKLTFQCSRNGNQNLPFCHGSLQDTFISYSSISHKHISQKRVAKKTKNSIMWNLKISRSENPGHNYCATRVYLKVSKAHFGVMLWQYYCNRQLQIRRLILDPRDGYFIWNIWYWYISGKKRIGKLGNWVFHKNCFFIIQVEIGEVWMCPGWPHGPYEDSATNFRAVWSCMASKSQLFNICR